MTKYSKFNPIYRLQKWLDSVPGQTFMNYAYSWGASIVILGALFKLTHLPGANLMLFLGMGTEVLVFFIAGFDRPFDKTEDGKDLPTHVNNEEDKEDSTQPGAAGVAASGSGAIIIGGSGLSGGNISIDGSANTPAGNGQVAAEVADGKEIPAATVTTGGIIGSIVTPTIPDIDPEEMEEATASYVDQLKELTETLKKVSQQSQRLTRDSEEMENLNRTLTGICKVYEMQLKGASQQIGTIDQINEQSKRMAEQIAELNKIYTRMIEAMRPPFGSPLGGNTPTASES